MPLTLYVARTVCGYELASGLFQGNPNRAFVEQRIITDMGSRCIRCAGMRGYMRHGDLSLAVQVGDRFLPWDPEYHARLSEVVELGLGPGGIVVFSVTFTHNKLAFDVTTPWSDPIGFLCPACYAADRRCACRSNAARLKRWPRGQASALYRDKPRC